jgi:hypothetical protein
VKTRGAFQIVLSMAVVLTLVSGPVLAENWIQYGSSSFFKAYIDSETIQFSDSGAEFWVMWVLNEKGKAAFAGKSKAKRKSLAILKGKWSVQCFPTPTAYEKSNYLFDKAGNLVEQNHVNSSYEIIPGTLMQTMHETVCEAVADRNADIAKENAKEKAKQKAENKTSEYHEAAPEQRDEEDN